MSAPVLSFEGLGLRFEGERGPVEVVRDIRFAIAAGETVAVVGESGCGKSVTALALMGLLPPRVARVSSGAICFEGEDLTRLSPAAWQRIRGRRIGMVFQEPMSALNPVLPIGTQLAEPLIAHKGLSPRAAWQAAIGLLARVGIPRPEAMAAAYPHALSGGMLQRVMIAMAISCEPALLIADEPTTALDVTIQAQILDLLRDIRAERQMAMMLITHDLGMVAEMADRVVVMYAGRVVEQGTVRSVFKSPRHPYTRGLLASRPVPGRFVRRLQAIPGQVPPLDALPPGCAFADRCSAVRDGCRDAVPALRGDAHQWACIAVHETEPEGVTA